MERVGPWARQLIACVGLVGLAALSGCEGQGDEGGGLRIVSTSPSPECSPAAGSFPSGLATLSAATGRAILVQTTPPGFVVYDVDAERPIPLVFRNVGIDSDADGIEDGAASASLFGFPLTPLMGEVQVLSDTLALVSTSNYEQVLGVDPSSAAPRTFTIEVPASVPAERYPLLPEPGTSATRSGLSTLACVFPDDPFDSGDQPIGVEPICDDLRPGFLTNLTAGKAVAAGRLFVVTSNLRRNERFYPGTVLVFEWIESGAEIRLRPDPETPVLFTSGFNPTGMARIETPMGRELILVTVTGAIGSGSGAGNVMSEASLDVIDPRFPRVVARIPLGFAGPSFEGPAIDPGGRVAWLGASSERQVYAVDLRTLDDPALYAPASGGTGPDSGPPVILDGFDSTGQDARIFEASAPLAIPARVDRPAPPSCAGFTHVSVNTAGSEVYVTDFCDGTLTRIRYDASEPAPIPYPRSRFQVAVQSRPFAPIDALGELRSPSVIVTRPGVPGVDFSTPDALVLVGQPDANLCAQRIEFD